MNYYLGIFTLSLLLSVLKADETGVVKITPDSPVRFVKVGDSVAVSCSVIVNKDEAAKIEWEKPHDDALSLIYNDVPLGSGSTSKKVYSNLTINSIKKSELGFYKCSFGASSKSFELKEPTEEKTQANYTYEGDKTATISCTVIGVDHEKIKKVVWLKNDTLVSELSDKKRFKEDPENRTLTITDTTRNDADKYIARYTFLDIEAPYDCAVMYAAAPLVLKFEKSKNLIEDDNMELQCKVKGYPRAHVEWLKNGKVLNITDGKRIKQTPLDGYKNARLVINNVQFDDAGDYTCRAFSAYFNASDKKTLVVRVKDKLAALWPFLGIVGEVVILCTIIFIYEKRRNKQAESEANNAEDVDSSSLKKEGVRHRGQKK